MSPASGATPDQVVIYGTVDTVEDNIISRHVRPAPSDYSSWIEEDGVNYINPSGFYFELG